MLGFIFAGKSRDDARGNDAGKLDATAHVWCVAYYGVVKFAGKTRVTHDDAGKQSG